jgi:hypothetical protein
MGPPSSGRAGASTASRDDGALRRAAARICSRPGHRSDEPVDLLAGNATCVTPPTMLRRLRQLNRLAYSAGLRKHSASGARDPHYIEPLATQLAQQSGIPQRVDLGAQLASSPAAMKDPQVLGEAAPARRPRPAARCGVRRARRHRGFGRPSSRRPRDALAPVLPVRCCTSSAWASRAPSAWRGPEEHAQRARQAAVDSSGWPWHRRA